MTPLELARAVQLDAALLRGGLEHWLLPTLGRQRSSARLALTKFEWRATWPVVEVATRSVVGTATRPCLVGNYMTRDDWYFYSHSATSQADPHNIAAAALYIMGTVPAHQLPLSTVVEFHAAWEIKHNGLTAS